MESIQLKPVYLKAPITMQMEVTRECNEACTYCYNFWRLGEVKPGEPIRPQVKLEDKVREDFFAYVDRLAEAEVFYVTITGGEPFLRRDILYDLVGHLNERDIDVSVNSNLSLVGPDELDQLIDRGVMNILTSLSSHKKEVHNGITNSNSYDKILRNIAHLKTRGFNIGVSMVVNQSNIDDVYDTGAFVAELGARSFYATPLSPTAENMSVHEALMVSKEQVINMLHRLVDLEYSGMYTGVLEPIPHCLLFHHNRLKKFLQRSCPAGTSTATVGVFGEVRSCSHSTGSYGNLNEENLISIWGRMNAWKTRFYVPTECVGCDAVERCLGGCRTAAEAASGSLSAVHPLMEEPLTLTHEEAPPVSTSERLMVPEGLKFRNEDNGHFVLYRSPQNVAIVTKSQLDLIALLRRRFGEGFSAESLKHEYDLEDAHMRFFELMARRGILIQNGGMNNGKTR